jgi:selenide,water dikinase
LDSVLPGLPRLQSANVLVGFETSDDAGVYRLSDTCALVQTVDFFTPIVDDPATYGRIAATNALSDIYAMGGRPLSALSILCYPAKGDLEELAEILRGGAEQMIAAGCVLLGGHSVNDDEIKFGYAVTGLVDPQRVWTNAGARAGDVLTLSKPLGTGVIGTAIKRGMAEAAHIEAAVASMTTLNRTDAEVHGATDVTGFGLLGHAREMALASAVTLEIEADKLEFLPGALEYSRAGAVPGGTRNNCEFAGCAVLLRREFPPELEALLYDPQTSGGLLLSQEPGMACGRIIGRVVERGEKPVIVL